jgi:GDPmannose 4,6-dehydratase
LQQKQPEDYIICSGESHSLEEFVKAVFDYFNLDYKKHIKIDKTLFRPNELENIYGDNSKAKAKLNWKYNIKFNELVHKLITDEMRG